MIIQFVRLCIAKNHRTAFICQRTTAYVRQATKGLVIQLQAIEKIQELQYTYTNADLVDSVLFTLTYMRPRNRVLTPMSINYPHNFISNCHHLASILYHAICEPLSGRNEGQMSLLFLKMNDDAPGDMSLDMRNHDDFIHRFTVISSAGG
jgi:hypothetical protein